MSGPSVHRMQHLTQRVLPNASNVFPVPSLQPQRQMPSFAEPLREPGLSFQSAGLIGSASQQQVRFLQPQQQMVSTTNSSSSPWEPQTEPIALQCQPQHTPP